MNEEIKSAFAVFANRLKLQAENDRDYARNMTRANGGDEPDDCKNLNDRASILEDVAFSARRAVGFDD